VADILGIHSMELKGSALRLFSSLPIPRIHSMELKELKGPNLSLLALVANPFNGIERR